MVLTLPHIAEKAIPLVLQWAQQHHIELPFSDYDSLKEVAMDTVKGQAQGLARFARGASSEMIRCVVAVVIAAGVFLNPHFQTAGDKTASPNSVYTVSCEAIAERIRTFYGSFATVMGAQIVISAVNTVLTACFVLAVQLPYGFVVVGATFICGLLPIIGNLISNTIIVGIGITVSPKMAIAALVFLVIVHKLEYFLNSKIVGDRIRNPFWMTLLALILGERLLGIPGMILAPVVLNYVRVEASRVSSGATQL
jgi:predicted PurR-regulated permease PerM